MISLEGLRTELAAGRRPERAAAQQRYVDEPSFWLRKGIGWALRRYARTDPAWVRGYVDGLGDRLSGLSRREATRHL